MHEYWAFVCELINKIVKSVRKSLQNVVPVCALGLP